VPSFRFDDLQSRDPMGIRGILVHLDSTPRSVVRLGLATELAMRHGAYLIGLYVTPPVPSADEQRDASAMSEEFHGWIRQQGIDGEWRPARGSAVDALTMHGRCTDLIVIGQHDPERHQGDLAEKQFVEILGRIGRPILAVPYMRA